MRSVLEKLPARGLFALLVGLGLGLASCGETEGAAGPADDRLQAAQEQLDGGHLSEARSAFEAAIEADPSSIDARLGLAESAHRLGDDATAQRAFEEVLGLGADRDSLIAALDGLAEIREVAGDPSGASDLKAEADSLRGGPSARVPADEVPLPPARVPADEIPLPPAGR
jgi:thioredoxin-like negative regulator of GroEL